MLSVLTRRDLFCLQQAFVDSNENKAICELLLLVHRHHTAAALESYFTAKHSAAAAAGLTVSLYTFLVQRHPDTPHTTLVPHLHKYVSVAFHSALCGLSLGGQASCHVFSQYTALFRGVHRTTADVA